jgi:hypothetical protein
LARGEDHDFEEFGHFEEEGVEAESFNSVYFCWAAIEEYFGFAVVFVGFVKA